MTTASLDSPLAALHVPERFASLLAAVGIVTAADFLDADQQDLLRIPGIDHGVISSVCGAIAESGIDAETVRAATVQAAETVRDVRR